jgi:hypothetical protein
VAPTDATGGESGRLGFLLALLDIHLTTERFSQAKYLHRSAKQQPDFPDADSRGPEIDKGSRRK